MADNATEVILSIKTSQDNAEPTSLANGELAYSYSSDKLYIGQTDTATDATTVEFIGGKVIVDKVANLESLVIDAGGEAQHANLLITDTLKFDTGVFAQDGVMWVRESGVVDFVNSSVEGKILQISANGVPVFDDLNGGTY